MNVTVLSCSMNPDSRSAALAERAWQALREAGAEVRWIDLREQALPICDGGPACADERVEALKEAIAGSDAVLLAVPVYNYYANAAAKNAIELTGRAWTDKVVGFLCAAGGAGSYMSVMSLANSLMLDFRCLIVPRFVYATGEAVGPDGTLAEPVRERIDVLCREMLRIGRALKEAEPVSPR